MPKTTSLEPKGGIEPRNSNDVVRTEGGESSPGISNDVVFGIFSPENAKSDVVRTEWGESSPGISNDAVFGIFSPENAKNDIVRNFWARFPRG